MLILASAEHKKVYAKLVQVLKVKKLHVKKRTLTEVPRETSWTNYEQCRSRTRVEKDRGKVERNRAVSQEEKEKSPHVELFCPSDYGRVGAAGFDFGDCDEVGEGGILLSDAIL